MRCALLAGNLHLLDLNCCRGSQPARRVQFRNSFQPSPTERPPPPIRTSSPGKFARAANITFGTLLGRAATATAMTTKSTMRRYAVGSIKTYVHVNYAQSVRDNDGVCMAVARCARGTTRDVRQQKICGTDLENMGGFKGPNLTVACQLESGGTTITEYSKPPSTTLMFSIRMAIIKTLFRRGRVPTVTTHKNVTAQQ